MRYDPGLAGYLPQKGAKCAKKKPDYFQSHLLTVS
jgi:hypothetical protein